MYCLSHTVQITCTFSYVPSVSLWINSECATSKLSAAVLEWHQMCNMDLKKLCSSDIEFLATISLYNFLFNRNLASSNVNSILNGYLTALVTDTPTFSPWPSVIIKSHMEASIQYKTSISGMNLFAPMTWAMYSIDNASEMLELPPAFGISIEYLDTAIKSISLNDGNVHLSIVNL